MKSKAEVISQAKSKGKKIHCAMLMDLCHLKNSGLNKKL